MVDEAIENPLIENCLVYVRQDWHQHYFKIKKRKNTRAVPDLPYQGTKSYDKSENWGSGGYALLIAALSYETVYLIGFDLYPTNSKVNNVYKGTNNYSNPEKHPVDPAYWIYQISKIFNIFKNKNFIVVNKPNWKVPEIWKTNNVKFITIEEFKVLTLNNFVV